MSGLPLVERISTDLGLQKHDPDFDALPDDRIIRNPIHSHGKTLRPRTFTIMREIRK